MFRSDNGFYYLLDECQSIHDCEVVIIQTITTLVVKAIGLDFCQFCFPK